MLESEVFVLSGPDGKFLSPGLQATVLAKYSRSPLSAREIIAGLTEEESSKFHEKWFVDYGHSSVGELTTIPLCFERVSMVASKFIESFQRAAYSEKSTRYQKFSSDSFVLPPGAPDSMREFASSSYRAYESLLPKVTAYLSEKLGRPEDRLIRARAFDNVRYLLPAGTGTNLGMVINARDLRHFLNQCLGHTNPEIRDIGEKTRAAVEKQFPVFVKNVRPDSFEPGYQFTGDLPKNWDHKPYVSLYKPELWLDSAKSHALFAENVKAHGMSLETFNVRMQSRSGRGVPKLFREIPIKLEVMEDFGSYRDLQRHRRMEIYPEPLSLQYGFVIPDDIEENSALRDEYCRAMQSAATYSDSAAGYDPILTSYIVPMGYLHRCVMSMDLAQLYYLTELRTKPQGHIAYRRTAYDMYSRGVDAYGDLMRWAQVTKPEEIGDHT